MMYTDMVYYVLIIVRLRGSVKEKRELRVKMCSSLIQFSVFAGSSFKRRSYSLTLSLR